MEVWNSCAKGEEQTEQLLQRAKCRGVKALWQMLWGRALHRITDAEAAPGHAEKGGTVGWGVVVQNVHNSTQRAGCAGELTHIDFLCEHWGSPVIHISAAFSSLFRSPQAKIPAVAADTTAGP